MPRPTKALSDTACKNAKPGHRPGEQPDGSPYPADGKPYKLPDGGSGMFLLVNPDGKKYWRWNYRHLRKQKTLAYGVYPDVTLAQARDKHQAARNLLASGTVTPVRPNRPTSALRSWRRPIRLRR